MKVEAFLLCDAATDQKDLLNVLGAFDNIWVKKVPSKDFAFSIAARIRNDEKLRRCSMQIKITDPDGKVIKPKINGSINFKGKGGPTNIILHITKMEFRQFGKYTFELIVNGEAIKSTPLYVYVRETKDDTGK